MTTVALIHEAFNKGISDVRAGAERLQRDRDSIDRRVSGFLGAGWTGVAAESFVDAWEEWKTGATEVLEGLTAMGELLEAAHRDFVASDEDSQQNLDRVAARIVERLG
jgi:WXG100 family type VII secretion target